MVSLRNSLALTVILLLASTIVSFAQAPNEAWIARYNGPGNSDEDPYDLLVDSSGNVYITGESWGVGSERDYTTIKHSSNGATVWISRYNGVANAYDYSQAMVLDQIGNLLITGSSVGSGNLFDAATIKYGPNGDTAWVRRYDSPVSGSDETHGIGVDSSGNVYVAGHRHIVGTNWNYLIIKYSPSGDTLWTRMYDGPASEGDDARVLTMDKGANVYAAGYSQGTPGQAGYDVAVVKYNSVGDLIWSTRYNGPGDNFDYTRDIEIDSYGNVYLAGQGSGIGTGFDFLTIKLDSAGDTVWVRLYNGPGNGSDFGRAMNVDDSGYVYVTGRSQGAGTGADYATVKYAPNGDTVWARRYNGAGNGDDAMDITLDDSGNVYVTGASVGLGSAEDFLTLKYSSNGNLLWTRSYNGPANGSDYAIAIEADQSGNLYITGQSTGMSSGFDFATIKYSACALAGDANANGGLSLSDIISTVNYIFNKSGCLPGPNCWLTNLLCRGDWNGGGTVTLADVIQGVNYVFNKPGGPWSPIPIGACCSSVP